MLVCRAIDSDLTSSAHLRVLVGITATIVRSLAAAEPSLLWHFVPLAYTGYPGYWLLNNVVVCRHSYRCGKVYLANFDMITAGTVSVFDSSCTCC